MAQLVLISWRDIPSAVLARSGRKTERANLPERFQHAIDRAAMRAGRGSSDHYLADWKRVPLRNCTGDLAEEVKKAAEEIEAQWPVDALEQLIRHHGIMNSGDDARPQGK